MNLIKNQKICLKEFIPEKVLCGKDASKSYDLEIIEDEIYLTLSYLVDSYNHLGCVGKRCFTLLLPKHIKRNQETFEVLGLLQAFELTDNEETKEKYIQFVDNVKRFLDIKGDWKIDKILENPREFLDKVKIETKKK